MQKSSKSWVNIKDSLERSLARHLEGVKNAFESEVEENGEKLSLLSKSLKTRRARLTLLCIEIIFLTRFCTLFLRETYFSREI